MEVTGNIVSETKRAENYPDFEILADLIPQGLRRFKVWNIEDESDDLSHIL